MVDNANHLAVNQFSNGMDSVQLIEKRNSNSKKKTYVSVAVVDANVI